MREAFLLSAPSPLIRTAFSSSLSSLAGWSKLSPSQSGPCPLRFRFIRDEATLMETVCAS